MKKSTMNNTGSLISKGEGKLREFTADAERGTVEDQIMLLEAELAILRGKVKKPDLAITEIWDTYAETLWMADMSESTIKSYRSAVRALSGWMEKQGCRYMGDIGKAEAEKYLRTLQKEIGIASFNNRLVLLKKVWREIAKAGKWNVQADAFERAEKIRGANRGSKVRALTDGEVKALIANAQDADMRLLLALGAYAGLRIADACNLKWSCVDFDKRVIDITPRMTKYRVIIPMHPELEKALREAREKATGEYVSESNRNNYVMRRMSQKVRALFEKCGIQTTTTVNGRKISICSFHSLHYSLLREEIEKLAKVA